MSEGNGQGRVDHIVAREFCWRAEDACQRAMDALSVLEDADVNWAYVSTQVSYAMAQLAMVQTMATMRANGTDKPSIQL